MTVPLAGSWLYSVDVKFASRIRLYCVEPAKMQVPDVSQLPEVVLAPASVPETFTLARGALMSAFSRV